MRTKQSTTQSVFSLVMILILSVSMFRPSLALAQGAGGVRREVNAQTGKISFLLPEIGVVLPAREALNGMSLSERHADPAAALANRFGVEFGLKDPARELVPVQRRETDNGQIKVHYQQSYQGIPVMGGELIVHTNGEGDLYSINGEVASDLSLPVRERDLDRATEVCLHRVPSVDEQIDGADAVAAIAESSNQHPDHDTGHWTPRGRAA